MEAKSLEDRVTLLENEMQPLRGLPDRVTSLETQMVQFRAEVRAEFSATRKELREEFREALSSEVNGLKGLIAKIDTKIDELGALMRTLHEETLARIALISRG